MERKDNYTLLIEKLDQFIRKYYLNQLIRGALYSISLLLVLFLVVNILEYFYYFDTTGRKALFYSFLAISFSALAFWVIRPIMSFFKLGTIISHRQAAQIIGNHFENVKDKLLNILQLRDQAEGLNDKPLIMASVNQKTEDIKLVPFKSAINLNQNRRYFVLYALPPFLVFIGVLLTAPNIIKEGTNRLINNNIEFEKPAPFSFVVDQENLKVPQYDDFKLNVEVNGDQYPDEVFIYLEDVSFRLKKEANNKFSYEFKTVQKPTDFYLASGPVESKDYKLDVLPKPNILGFEVKLNYPNYTDRKDETLDNIGDLVIPEGTTIDWIFNAENTDDINIRFSTMDSMQTVKRFSNDLFTFKKTAFKDDIYKLFISNNLLPKADSVSYALSVIPDLYPTISTEKFQDSLDNKLLYFAGNASDDYGLSLLTFNYRRKNEEGVDGKLKTLPLSRPNSKGTEFDYAFDLNELALNPGEQVSYYFEVFDNDGVNGVKSARTNMMVYSMPTLEEFEKMAEENDEKIKDDLQKALRESKKIQEDMKKMREKLLQQKELDWQDRKELEKMLERQKELEKQIQDAKKAFEENRKNQQEYSQPDQEMMEKQDRLEQMFDEVMSEEMQQLMEQIEKMLQELEKDQALEMMQESEFNNEEIEKDLDRLLELFKQLELEQETKEAIDKLEKLAEEQDELRKETEEMDKQQDGEQNEEEGENKKENEGNQEENKEAGEEKENKEGEQKENKQGEENKNQEGEQKENNQEKQDKDQEGQQNKSQEEKQGELEKKQEDINKKFEDIQKQMEDIEKKNQELQNSMPMQDKEQEMQDIQQELEKSQQQLQQQQNKKASKSQKNASQKMQQMAQAMQQQMQSNQMQQMQEDMKALRQLLENLVGLSFDQEQLVDDISKTSTTTPKYVELVQEQFKLKDDFKLIEDSLQELSKRVMQIESFVTEKVTEINSNMSSSIKELEERQKVQASDNQQRVMKNVNDLALMLSEVMNQMQQQMASMMKDSQMCNNPNGNAPQDKISEGQKKLNEQMQQMKKGMKDGGGISSEEFAKMAARQAALRKALEEQQKKLREQGQGKKELQQMIDQMDKVEKDLVNKRLENETLERQQEILTRLLKHEDAERQREFDNKRKSETAEPQQKRLPPALEEYIKKRNSEIELYRTISPSLKPYYKFLVEEYFKSLKSK